MLRKGTRAALALGVHLVLSTLAAAGAASELSWVGPADCAESEQLVFQVERALGAPLARVAHLRFQVHVERSVPDARALLRVTAGDESATKERLLAAPDCGALVDTLAVAVALAIDAAASTVEPVPAVSRGVSSEASSASAPNGPPEVAAPPSSEPAVRLDDVPASSEASPAGPVPRAAFWLLGDAGSLPAPAVGMALGLELGWPRLQLRLLGTLWVEQHTELARADEGAAGADLNLAAGTVLACTTPSEDLGVSLCGGLEMGAMSGAGTGVANSRQATALWWAPRVEAGVFWNVPASQLRVGAQLGAAMPLNRDAFVLDEIGTVHRPAAVAARAGLYVDVALE